MTVTRRELPWIVASTAFGLAAFALFIWIFIAALRTGGRVVLDVNSFGEGWVELALLTGLATTCTKALWEALD